MVGHTDEAVDQMFNKQLSLMIKNLSKGRKRVPLLWDSYIKNYVYVSFTRCQNF